MSDKATKLQPLFDLIDEAGGPSLPNIKSLDFSKKQKVSFNLWAFLFTIFYYLYHGMNKKCIVLFVVSIIAIVLVEEFIPAFSSFSWVITSVIFATRANIDLYKKYKLDNNSWI